MLRLAALIASLAAAPLAADPVTVFAAASLKGPLDRIAAEAGAVTVAYAGSGVLARQVAQGAPADVLVLANTAWMDWAAEEGAIDPASRRVILTNRLVLVAPAPAAPVTLSPDAIGTALGDGRLAIGLTRSVPAGQYGRAALEALELWPEVADRLAEVESVRAALALAARGEVPLALVYATDARAETRVDVVAEIPVAAHPPIRYEAALVPGASAASAAFLERLSGHPAFVEAGFGPSGG